MSQTDELGKPLLPVKYVKLIIPSNQDVDKVILTNIAKREIEGEYMILPAQPGIPTSVDFQEPAFVPPDSSVYNSDQPYPAEAVKVIRDGYFDGSNHIVTVAFYPLQYKPKSGRLLFYSFIDFELTMKPGGILRAPGGMRSRKNQKVYDAILERIVDNPWDIPLYRTRPSLGKVMKIQTNPLPSYEYVIITNNTLKNEFDAFVSWKKRKGWDIGVVTMDSITTYYSNDDTSGITDDAGALRQYLADSFNDGSPKTMWALLAGDHTIVPVRYGAGSNNCSWADNSFYKIPADLYFAEFNGDWNVDTETPTRYGEPSDDDPEYEPEIYVGRIPVTSAQEVEIWIDKLLQYELKPGNGIDSYLCKAFWVSADQMINQPDDVDDYYPSSFTGNHTKYKEDHPGDEVVEEMSNHYGLLNWYCHGNVNSFDAYDPTPSARFVWTTDDGEYWDTSDNLVQSGTSGDGLDNMTNDNYPSVVYSICCDACAFDDFRSTDNPGSWPNDGNYYPTDQRSMAEGFTCMNWYINGPIILGNARLTWVSDAYKLHEEFCDVWDMDDFHNAGIAALISKYNYGEHYLSYSHNCYGCPETEIWTDSLDSFTNVAISDNGNSISVNANVSGCNICVCSGNNGKDFWQVESDVSNYTFNTSERPLYITITKHNYAPYTAVTGGTFSSDEIWFGNLLVLGDVTIDSAKTLDFLPRTRVVFESNSDDQSGGYNSSKCELIVDGTLDAEGATFTAENTRDWYGIRFNSTASNCKLDSCTIENADYNVRITGSSPLIDQCTFDGGLYAVIVESDGADPTVRKCDIKNVNYGIRLQTDTEGDYYDNKISTLSRGIYIYNGDGNFYSNSINYSGGYGICVLGSYANPDITGTYTGSERGNYFDSNMGNDVIYVGSGSPILGYGTPSGACGYNLFEDVPSGDYDYYIDNNTGSSLQAEYNYWHDGTAPDDSDFDGTVDYTPYEDTEPDAGTTWKRNVASSLYAEALQAYRHRDYEKVITLVPQAIEQDADHPLAHPVLNRYFSALRNQNKLSMQEINSTLTPGYSDDIQQIAHGWKIRYYAENNQMNNAEKLALSVSKNSLFERVLLLDVLYFYARFDETEAIERIKNILTVRHKDDTISEDIESALDAGRIDKLVYPEPLPKSHGTDSENLPKKLTIVNYPNPCNPTTTILFTLPKDGHVKIDIYNTRGQKVRNLADNHFSKGQHTVQWKGRNDFNSQVATGVYFYHVRFKDQAITKKLLLLQ